MARSEIGPFSRHQNPGPCNPPPYRHRLDVQEFSFRKRICFVSTVSITQEAFILDLAKFLHETGEFEVHLTCWIPTEIATWPAFHSRPHGARHQSRRCKGAAADVPDFPEGRIRFGTVLHAQRLPACCHRRGLRQDSGSPLLSAGEAFVGFEGAKRAILEEAVAPATLPDFAPAASLALRVRAHPLPVAHRDESP